MSGIHASDIVDKISSIHTDAEMNQPAAVMTGLQELAELFMKFCSEIDATLDTISNNLTEMMGELSGQGTR